MSLKTDFHPEPDENTLVTLLKARDLRILDYIYSRYAPPLYGLIHSIVKEEAAADELLKDTFVTIWESIDSYNHHRSQLFTWMIQIARKLAKDYVRSLEAGRRESASLVQLTGSAVEAAVTSPNRSVQELLEKLPAESQAVVRLVYFDGYSPADAGEKLNVPLATIHTRLRSALVRLRELLQPSF